MGYFGASVGDIACGILSHRIKSRLIAVKIYLCCCVTMSTIYLFLINGATHITFYIVIFLCGVFYGYYGMFATIAAE
jgi:hypothetical protein